MLWLLISPQSSTQAAVEAASSVPSPQPASPATDEPPASPATAEVSNLPSFAAMRSLLDSATSCSLEACRGQPSACPTLTRGLASTRPANATFTHQLTIENKANGDALLAWVSPNGSEASLLRLGAGERRTVKSYTGDVWRARALAGGALLMEAQTGPVSVRDCGCLDRPLVVCPPRERKPRNASDGGGPKEPAGFVNRAAVPLHVWVAGRSCEVLLTESSPIAAGGYRLFNAWRGQTFRARDASTGRLVAEHLVGSLLVPACLVAPQMAEAEADPEARLGDEARHALRRLAATLLAERRVRDAQLAAASARISELEQRLARLEPLLGASDGGGGGEAEQSLEPATESTQQPAAADAEAHDEL